MAIPQDWRNLGFTSGRRTYRGNKLVGGVNNSDHLTGSAADFTADAAALRARFGSGVRILDEGDHRHVSGLSDVPYHGNKGIAGLVNGVDTTAPKGSPMQQPMRNRPRPMMRDPITAALQGNDPLMPQQESWQQNPYYPEQAGGQMAQPQMPAQPNFAAASQPANGVDPLAPTKKPGAFGKGGVGWSILGIIGDAMAGYGGQQGSFGPAMAQKAEGEREDNRFQQRLEAERQMKMEAMRAKLNEPDEITNSAGDRINLYRDGRQEVAYMDPYGKPRTESRLNPATGALEVFNTGSTPRPQADDIADLRRDPSLARDFDAEFGPGSAAYILRGAR